MKNCKKLLLCLLAVLMLLSLAACSDNGEDNGRPTLRLFLINGNYVDGAMKDSVWKHIEDKIGVNIEITGQVNSDDYYTVLSPQLNSALDMPDIFFSVPDGTGGAYDAWADQATGILYDWKNLMAGNEDQYPHLVKLLNSDTYKNLTYNGATTLLPMLSIPSNGWGIYYRGDWLIKIGYYTEDENGEKVPRVPVNMDEFQDVMMKFSDPSYNLNPGNKTYGLSPFAGEWANQPLYHAFGAPTDYDINEKGEVEFMCLTEEYKNFLTWFHQCYENGWIDPQFYANGQDGDLKAFEEGRCGILINSAGNHIQWKAIPMEKVWGKGTCVMGPPPVGTASVGAEGAGGWSNWGGWWGGLSITKACTETDAALRLMDYLYSEEGAMTAHFGIQGKHWDWNEDHTQIVANLENRLLEPEGAFYLQTGINGDQNLYGKHRFSNILLAPDPIDWENYDSTGEFSFFHDWNAVNPEYAYLMANSAEYFDQVCTSKLLNLNVLPSNLTKKVNVIADLCNTYAIQAIAGQKNLSSDWDALVQSCQQQDLQKIYDTYLQAAKDMGIVD